MSVQPVPEGYNTLSPALAVENAAEAIEFYKRAFGATERFRMEGPGGTIAHAELEIGDSVVMLADPFAISTVRPPKEIGGTTVSIFVYTEDVDAFVQRAVDAGATVVMAVADQFWGDRYGTISDPFGHHWAVATHVEDVSPEEMARRGEQAMAAMTGDPAGS